MPEYEKKLKSKQQKKTVVAEECDDESETGRTERIFRRKNKKRDHLIYNNPIYYPLALDGRGCVVQLAE